MDQKARPSERPPNQNGEQSKSRQQHPKSCPFRNDKSPVWVGQEAEEAEQEVAGEEEEKEEAEDEEEEELNNEKSTNDSK
eukprot:1835127-Amphidinium_carterae.1